MINGTAHVAMPVTNAAMARMRSALESPRADRNVSSSTGPVSIAVWTLMPVAKAARNAPIVSAIPPARPISVATRSACAATANARPVTSLSGLDAFDQMSGEVAANAAAQNARQSSPSIELNSTNSSGMSAAPNSALQNDRARDSALGTRSAFMTGVLIFPSAMNTG